jgi:hypothetical protein
VDYDQLRQEFEAISARPLEERADALDELITRLERELESTSAPAREQPPRS